MSFPIPTSKVNPNGAGSVSMEEFIRTRDSVVTGLTKLNGAIGTLISAYVTHTNTLLNGAGQAQAVLDPNLLTEYLVNAGLSAPKGNGEGSSGKEKKKRAKKEKDPNAPKRPLTAFFLFSTRAREHIKSDLGDSATPVEINNEILRRWNDMDGPQKERWKEIYNQNYEQYKKEVEAYRLSTGQDVPVEAAADAHEAPTDPAVLNALPGAAGSDDDSSEEEVEPPKAPTPPPAKKTKATKGKKKAAAAEPAAPTVTSPSPSAQLQGPARSTTAIPLPTPTQEKRKKGAKEESPEQPKKKKSRKSEAAEKAAEKAAPAPAPAAPEKKKKKSKKGE